MARPAKVRDAAPRSKRGTQHAPRDTKSVNSTKSKIRDLERALNHSDHLPADVRIEKERALAGYKQDLQDALNSKQKQKLVGKYHRVRFFERQKATRRLRQLKNRLARGQSEVDESQLQQDVDDAEVDLNYTIYFPLTEKYQSLFPRGEHALEVASAGDVHTSGEDRKQQRPAMWNIIKSCMVEGNLEQLREGRLGSRYLDTGHQKKQYPPKAMRAGNLSREDKPVSTATRGGKTNMEDDDSDGGFFEV